MLSDKMYWLLVSTLVCCFALSQTAAAYVPLTPDVGYYKYPLRSLSQQSQVLVEIQAFAKRSQIPPLHNPGSPQVFLRVEEQTPTVLANFLGTSSTGSTAVRQVSDVLFTEEEEPHDTNDGNASNPLPAVSSRDEDDALLLFITIAGIILNSTVKQGDSGSILPGDTGLQPVPDPASIVGLGVGLVGLLLCRRKH